MEAFVTVGSEFARARGTSRMQTARGCVCSRRRSVTMLIDPSGRVIPKTDEQKGPSTYIPLEGYPGTFPPGTAGDNFPLEDYLDVSENVQHQELDIDEVTPDIFRLDEDFLEYLEGIGRLVPRSEEDDEMDEDIKKQMSGITEEDLEYGDNDEEEVLNYFTRSGLDSSMMSPMNADGYNYEDMY